MGQPACTVMLLLRVKALHIMRVGVYRISLYFLHGTYHIPRHPENTKKCL